MPKIMVTGVNGFVGQHLARELSERGCDIVGVGHDNEPNQNIRQILTHYVQCDLTEQAQVASLDIDKLDAVISLAGLANVGRSFGDPEGYKHINVAVFALLAERLAKESPDTRVVAVSTGAVYDPEQPMPLTETSKTKQSSPYAESKLLMEQEAARLAKAGLDVVVARPFNHSGPGQLPGFLIPDLYQKITDAQTADGIIKVGNLKTRRDYTDVRDIVRAYCDLALSPRLNEGVYNVCSGLSRSGEEILNLMLDALGASDVKVQVDQSLIRPNDPVDLYGSYARLKADTGWMPQIPFEQTIKDFVYINQNSSDT